MSVPVMAVIDVQNAHLETQRQFQSNQVFWAVVFARSSVHQTSALQMKAVPIHQGNQRLNLAFGSWNVLSGSRHARDATQKLRNRESAYTGHSSNGSAA